MLELFIKHKLTEAGGESFVGKQSLVALDTDHIKQYVFGTDKLKEIRGASSILDKLNRDVMRKVAREVDPEAEEIYANGGSGLFLIDGDEGVAGKFGRHVQQEYSKETQGGASITFAVQEIPDSVQDVWNDDIWYTLELLRFGLAEKKSSSLGIVAFPSHPFLRHCDACGSQYAEKKDFSGIQDDADREGYYCDICWTKRLQDGKVKDGIDAIVAERNHKRKQVLEQGKPFAWAQTIKGLPDTYQIPDNTDRPSDFNKFGGHSEGKDYLALIYADGNGMGQLMGDLRTLTDIRKIAKLIDEAVYEAMSFAINEYLKVVPANKNEPPMFPFDILLIGGDDIMIVTPADLALDVAYTIGKKFYEYTSGKGPAEKDYTLSIGVVLAPVKYPFGLLQGLAESTLKYAKKEGAKRKSASAYGDTFINFMTVTGNTSHDFNKVYKSLHDKHVKVSGQGDVTFYATLRPYTVEELELLLDTIREGKKNALGRTKLHQVRGAVLKLNLTTSVSEAMAILRNWRTKQREFVIQHVYTMGRRYQEPHRDLDKPGTLFPRVTFPWFADGPQTYRTSLLDFAELYDFVAQEGIDDEAEN
jgi:hypothetical protein